MIFLTHLIFPAYQLCRSQCESPNEAAQFMSSAKLSLKGVITKIEVIQIYLAVDIFIVVFIQYIVQILYG